MKNIEKTLAAAAILILLIYTSINYINRGKNNKKNHIENSNNIKKDSTKKLNELDYIIDVINNGSNHLGFKGGEMEGGFVPKSKAKDVACYLMKLRKTPCKDGFSKDAPLYFSSNCAGCHGNNAKGIKDSYPNLLRKPFLGINLNSMEYHSQKSLKIGKIF